MCLVQDQLASNVSPLQYMEPSGLESRDFTSDVRTLSLG